MPANQDTSAPNTETQYRLTTGEIVSQAELIQRVTERVYQLWREDMQIARSRGSEHSLGLGRFPRGWRG